MIIDITEFAGILVLMCEWFLTSKKMELGFLCEQPIFILFTRNLVKKRIYSNLLGLMCERDYLHKFTHNFVWTGQFESYTCCESQTGTSFFEQPVLHLLPPHHNSFHLLTTLRATRTLHNFCSDQQFPGSGETAPSLAWKDTFIDASVRHIFHELQFIFKKGSGDTHWEEVRNYELKYCNSIYSII